MNTKFTLSHGVNIDVNGEVNCEVKKYTICEAVDRKPATGFQYFAGDCCCSPRAVLESCKTCS